MSAGALDGRILRALCAAPAPRSAEDLAATLRWPAGQVRAALIRLADRGYAREEPAWALTRTAHAAWPLHTGRSTPAGIAAQRAVLAALAAAGGARTCAELAADNAMFHGHVSKALRALENAACVRRVDAWQPTRQARRVLDTHHRTPPHTDPGCLFCRPHDPGLNTVVGAWGTVYARWDNFPASQGHIELVPIRHVLSFFDLTRQEVSDLHHLARLVRHDLDQRIRPDGYTIGVNDGEAAGRSIHHLHLHLIPRWHGDVPDPRGGIRRIFPHCDPDTWNQAGTPGLTLISGTRS